MFRQTHLKNTHTQRERREGQRRINGCALIDKLIKQTKTHIKTQTECKADTHFERFKERKKSIEMNGAEKKKVFTNADARTHGAVCSLVDFE